MAGLTRDTPSLTELIVHQKSRVLEVAFADGFRVRLPFELLRVYSPSAEVRGHGPGQEVLQFGKRDVGITALEPVGNYGVRPVFTDGHETGIFSWDYLYMMGHEAERLWREYEERMASAGASRDAPNDAGGSAGSTFPMAPKTSPLISTEVKRKS